MQITLEIADDQFNRIIDAFAKSYGYQDAIPNPHDLDSNTYISNPQTPCQFFKEKLIEHIKIVVAEYEVRESKKEIVVESVNIS